VRTVVFTGAGASYPFGFPLTRDIFTRIRKQLVEDKLFGAGGKDKRATLKARLTGLLPGFLEVDPLPWITDVLGLIDYSLQVETTPIRGATASQLHEARQLLEEAIFQVLDWPYGPSMVPPHLLSLARWIEQQHDDEGSSLALISTNYDISIDELLFAERGYDLERIAREIDFGFAWRDHSDEHDRIFYRPANASLAVYKLHGALNWLRCDACQYVYINPAGVIAHRAYQPTVDVHNQCHCYHAPLRAVLVTPSLVRDIRDVTLLETWKAALESLRLADEWIIIGYSFPSEDLAIRSLFLRAFNGREDHPRIRVVQPSFDKDTTARYKALFPRFEAVPGGMEAFAASVDKLASPRRTPTIERPFWTEPG
jgi:hypothetical protein